MSAISVLDRSHTVARHDYNRWLVPPAALAIHLCIGQAYAFSVFNLPLSKVGGWKLTELGWIFTLAIVFLGLSAAFMGRWVEEQGPRKAMFTAACFFGGGFIISAFGTYAHNIWLMYVGYGIIGGIGLGIGYISPVSTLIKWFPDRPGMATGLAIMGFGGGALIASPLSVFLMSRYANIAPQGVAPTFLTLGILYFCVMMVGTFLVRLPAQGWKPAGYVAPAAPQKLITTRHVHVDQAVRTPQFYLLWWVLCLNVTAGIGVLGQASAMSQEMFPGRVSVVAAAGFVGLLSLFNMGGRFFWASFSDYIGRKNTYVVFFLLGAVLYAIVPSAGRAGNIAVFVACYCVILSMYGGGFSTIPAYLRDIFGTMHVGAIHGRLLTAWSAAGVFGPVIVNYMRQYQIAHGVPASGAYNTTMYVMALLLVIGLICNLLMTPVHERHYYSAEEELAANAEPEAAV
ncbi:MAG TPA: OFA family MFS transporter [Candidatus Baltobacteraceae bacterium]|nr:OFA family MFS transporter [Candidatus Baltobacteraceae bacterium]